MRGGRQKNLVLILAREFASRLATAMFITDAEGALVYYNEPAEVILGRAFAEAGEMHGSEWRSLVRPERFDGSPIPLNETPTGIALSERRPAHDVFRITGLDGRTRVVSATAFPLFAHVDDFVGAVAIFWELPEDPE